MSYGRIHNPPRPKNKNVVPTLQGKVTFSIVFVSKALSRASFLIFGSCYNRLNWLYIQNCIYKRRRRKMRKLISIRIDPKIYQTAREMGLNISKTCENSLKQEIQRPTNANPETNCMSTCVSTSQQLLWSLGRDSNPRPPPYQGDALAN
jgi:post-segregation antitoxin (ccd killing protein)